MFYNKFDNNLEINFNNVNKRSYVFNAILTIVFSIAILFILGCIGSIFLKINVMNKNSELEMIRIPYANQTIYSDEYINSNMISFVEVPKAYMIGLYYDDSSYIIGKCVNSTTIVVEGSIFYKDMIVDCKI